MELLFYRVYEMADLMADVIDISGSFEELYWDSPNVGRCLIRFSKTSLLSHFCFTHIRLHQLRKCRKDPETVDFESVEQAFTRYAIPFTPFEVFIHRKFPEGQEDENVRQDALYPWMLEQEEEAFGLLWEKMTDEVFHLLFGNRSFLLNFNLQLAEFRQERGDVPSPRCSIPQWVKRAVYFRENGKCALCKKDLSGLIAIDPKQHYDHMVPLKALGANDPCNIQLLCAKCNLVKAASPARTSSVYDPWWKG
jgi:hypothetical protein